MMFMAPKVRLRAWRPHFLFAVALWVGLLSVVGRAQAQQQLAMQHAQPPVNVPAPQDPAPASPVGLWQTISDVDGKPKAYVRIREQNGNYVGVIEEIIDPAKRAERCEKCPGERHDLPVLGLTILTGLHRDGDHFGGGEILDPDNGKVYSCKLTLTDAGQHLEVRGYIGISWLGRTQTWNRTQ
jgi:uncharacterized protein (DUF2147 family)